MEYKQILFMQYMGTQSTQFSFEVFLLLCFFSSLSELLMYLFFLTSPQLQVFVRQ